MSLIPLSLQLYTVRDNIASDLPGTLKAVAEAGYKNVEGGGFGGVTPAEYGKILSDNGLSIPGAHVGIPELVRSDYEATVGAYKSLGVTTVIVPHVGADIRQDGKGYGKLAETLNGIGEKLKPMGVNLAYHNHDFEFNDKDGSKSGYDILLAETDPSVVKFELDTYWALKAGVDPVNLIKTQAARLILLHLKDMDPDDKSFAPVGTGILPLDGILAAAPSGVEYLVVEQDLCKKQTPLEAIKISYDTLKAKGYS